MTRDQALAKARAAAARAEELARAADLDLAHPTLKHETHFRTATGTLWADVAAAYINLAAALPETENTHG